jgi:hypothetical protein
MKNSVSKNERQFIKVARMLLFDLDRKPLIGIDINNFGESYKDLRIVWPTESEFIEMRGLQLPIVGLDKKEASWLLRRMNSRVVPLFSRINSDLVPLFSERHQDKVTLVLLFVKDQDDKWVGYRMYAIDWNGPSGELCIDLTEPYEEPAA